jgi:microcin C transport system substrate-binding protein
LPVRPISTRKAVSQLALAGLLSVAFLASAVSIVNAREQVWRHAVALTGSPKYPADFEHFDYVNPQAPQGGRLNLSAFGTFDSLNPILAKGERAAGLGYVYETLMTPSLDEINAEYGLLADAVSYPDDFSSVTYRLRENAHWHDGTPVTPEDVVWSFEKAVELDPRTQFYYRHVTGAEKTGEREVTFTFDEKYNRELPQIVGQLMILPKHWWQGTDAQGRQRSVERTTLEPPMGSGPYRITEVSPPSSIEFEKVEDYWGKDLPVNVGSNNFASIRQEYYADRNAEFEAFKAGKVDFWRENKAARWAQEFDFPAFNAGRVKKEMLENTYRSSGVMVGFVPNLRREKFQDPKVREALGLAFDFETLNRTIFFDQYERVDSYFYGSELASDGLPEGKELEILEKVRDKVPEEAFTTEYSNPVGGDPARLRANLAEAIKLFGEAGYELRGRKMVDKVTGKPFTFEILLDGATIERVALPFSQNLKKIGVEATVRTVDATQYTNRERSRDFDMIYESWSESLSPGNEQLEFWGSEAAARDGSANYAGIADPGIDALIREIIFAPDRETLVAATKALDRVLLAHHYVIPSYTLHKDRIAYWNRITHPEDLPYYSIGFPEIWWSTEAGGQ